MINPNKYIRKGLIDLIAPATGLPVYDVSIPLDEILPNQYILLHSQTKRKTAQSKWCYEWMCYINIDVFSVNKKGFVSSVKNDDIEGYKGWTMSVDGRLLVSTLSSSGNRVLQKIINGGKFTVAFASGVGVSPEIVIEGLAIATGFDMTAAASDDVSYTVNFTGCGAFTTYYVDEFWTLINAMPADADKPNIVDTTDWS